MQNQQIKSDNASQLSSLPPIGNLLKRTWQVYRERFQIFLGITILFLVVSLFLNEFIPWFSGKLSQSTILARFPLAASNIIFILSLIIITAIVVVLIQIWIALALFYAIKERKGGIGLIDSFRKGWYKILSYLWIYIITGFFIFGGYVLFIIPGIIFSIWFIFSFYILVSEDLRGLNALFRSKQLVKRYWWKVFGRFIVIALIQLAIFLPFVALFVVSSFFLKVSSSPALSWLGLLFYQFVLLLFVPFTTTYSCLICEDLRQLKEGVPFEAPKRKTKIIFILIGIAGLVILGLGIGLSVWFWKASLPRQVEVRDNIREMDKMFIQDNLGLYYSQNNTFPTNLDQLISTFLPALPRDPKTNLPYSYKVLSKGEDYELCIDFEKKEDECVHSSVKPPADETINWKTYRNEEYGFELTFSERWKDYKVSKEANEGITDVIFKLKHTRDEKYHTVFNIGIYPKEKWEQLQSEEGPSVGTYLGEKGEYVFDYSMGHDDEGYMGFPEVTPGEIYQGPFYDVETKIIPTFKFID